MTCPEGVIFVFEDNPERLRQIVDVIRELFPRHELVVRDDCAEAIAWLREHQAAVDLITLDHDMDSVPRAGEARAVDHGCGRDLANFLATQPPTCPVIVHSANDVAATGMFFELKRANWPVCRVRPCDEHAWVKRDWRRMVTMLAGRGWFK